MSKFQCQYIDRGHYTVVCTPHFRKAGNERKSIVPRDLARYFDRMFDVGKPFQVSGTRIDNCFVYFRVIDNRMRDRWELELITLTPTTRFHTKELQHAVYIHI